MSKISSSSGFVFKNPYTSSSLYIKMWPLAPLTCKLKVFFKNTGFTQIQLWRAFPAQAWIWEQVWLVILIAHTYLDRRCNFHPLPASRDNASLCYESCPAFTRLFLLDKVFPFINLPANHDDVMFYFSLVSLSPLFLNCLWLLVWPSFYWLPVINPESHL